VAFQASNLANALHATGRVSRWISAQKKAVTWTAFLILAPRYRGAEIGFKRVSRNAAASTAFPPDAMGMMAGQWIGLADGCPRRQCGRDEAMSKGRQDVTGANISRAIPHTSVRWCIFRKELEWGQIENPVYTSFTRVRVGDAL